MSAPTGGDLVEHELSEDCVCGPSVLPVKADDGSVVWVYGHHSVEGREFDEPDYRGQPMRRE